MTAEQFDGDDRFCTLASEPPSAVMRKLLDPNHPDSFMAVRVDSWVWFPDRKEDGTVERYRDGTVVLFRIRLEYFSERDLR